MSPLSTNFHLHSVDFLLLYLFLSFKYPGGQLSCTVKQNYPNRMLYSNYTCSFCRFFSHELNWLAAENFCRNFTVPSLGEWGEVTGTRSGHLVSIHSQPEQDFVTALYESSRKKGVSNELYNFGIIQSPSVFEGGERGGNWPLLIDF